jgi:hypothetical protein
MERVCLLGRLLSRATTGGRSVDSTSIHPGPRKKFLQTDSLTGIYRTKQERSAGKELAMQAMDGAFMPLRAAAAAACPARVAGISALPRNNDRMAGQSHARA